MTKLAFVSLYFMTLSQKTPLPSKTSKIFILPLFFAEMKINLYLHSLFRGISSAGLEHLPYKQRVGGSNPSSPTNQKSRTRGISRSCTLYILFTLRKLTNTTLDFLLMYLIDFANTIVNLRDFQIPADPGLLCIPRTLIIKKML